MIYIVNRAISDGREGTAKEDHQTFKRYEDARQTYEDYKRVRSVFWIELAEKESNSHCAVRLDSWVRP